MTFLFLVFLSSFLPFCVGHPEQPAAAELRGSDDCRWGEWGEDAGGKDKP